MEIESSGKRIKTNEHKEMTSTTFAPTPTSTFTPAPDPKFREVSPRISGPHLEDPAQDGEGDNDEEDIRTTAKLGVRITIKAECVRVEWLKGRDSVLWESFCGMLKRAIITAVGGGGSEVEARAAELSK